MWFSTNIFNLDADFKYFGYGSSAVRSRNDQNVQQIHNIFNFRISNIDTDFVILYPPCNRLMKTISYQYLRSNSKDWINRKPLNSNIPISHLPFSIWVFNLITILLSLSLKFDNLCSLKPKKKKVKLNCFYILQE